MRKKHISIILFFLIIIIVVSAICPFSAASYATTFDIQSDIVMLVSLDTGSALFEKNIDRQFSPMAFTKIVTAMLAIENCENLNVEITAPSEAFDELYGTNSATAGFLVGEKLTMNQLLHGLLLQSANEAANIIAYYISDGDIPAFIDMMNNWAAELGCKDTHFTSAHGLFDDGQVITASDLLLICKKAYENETFMEIVNTTRYSVGSTNIASSRTLVNTNYLIDKNYPIYYYEYASGIKTSSSLDGSTTALVSTAEKNGYKYLCVIAGSPYNDTDGDGERENQSMLETKKLYDWAFDNFIYKTIVSPTETVCEIKVEGSWNVDHLMLIPEKEISELVPSGLDYTGIFVEPIKDTIPDSVTAPVNKGDIIGQASVKIAGSEVTVINLVASETVERNTFVYITLILHNIITSIWFKLFIALLLVLIIVYIVLMVAANRKKKGVKKIRHAELKTNGRPLVRTMQPKGKRRVKPKKYRK